MIVHICRNPWCSRLNQRTNAGPCEGSVRIVLDYELFRTRLYKRQTQGETETCGKPSDREVR